jgi:hypothetical protein
VVLKESERRGQSNFWQANTQTGSAGLEGRRAQGEGGAKALDLVGMRAEKEGSIRVQGKRSRRMWKKKKASSQEG